MFLSISDYEYCLLFSYCFLVFLLSLYLKILWLIVLESPFLLGSTYFSSAKINSIYTWVFIP